MPENGHRRHLQCHSLLKRNPFASCKIGSTATTKTSVFCSERGDNACGIAASCQFRLTATYLDSSLSTTLRSGATVRVSAFISVEGLGGKRLPPPTHRSAQPRRAGATMECKLRNGDSLLRMLATWPQGRLSTNATLNFSTLSPRNASLEQHQLTPLLPTPPLQALARP